MIVRTTKQTHWESLMIMACSKLRGQALKDFLDSLIVGIKQEEREEFVSDLKKEIEEMKEGFVLTGIKVDVDSETKRIVQLGFLGACDILLSRLCNPEKVNK
jgi:hypothetical protein